MSQVISVSLRPSLPNKYLNTTDGHSSSCHAAETFWAEITNPTCFGKCSGSNCYSSEESLYASSIADVLAQIQKRLVPGTPVLRVSIYFDKDCLDPKYGRGTIQFLPMNACFAGALGHDSHFKWTLDGSAGFQAMRYFDNDTTCIEQKSIVSYPLATCINDTGHGFLMFDVVTSGSLSLLLVLITGI
ncbi:UNVERIFIED_CONTAM: hypothetical protein HDU68_001145 [Siphonaria sp. JEL0065]|nr:hypothetical protein HDU68_001145 [Siphonaria sp. JEL0065]